MKLCVPAITYFVLACLSILIGIMSSISTGSLVAKGIYTILWTWILDFLCRKGFEPLSWVLVILPFVVVFGVVALVFEKGRPSGMVHAGISF
jgi:hypothetical protein